MPSAVLRMLPAPSRARPLMVDRDTTTPLPSLRALFAMLASRFHGDAEALSEDAVLDLVARAREGDTDARHRLYTQHVDRVFRTVRGMVSSDADAEDVTQDALLTVLTSLHTYRPREDARFAAWVMTIAVNTLRRRFRRRRPELTDTGDVPDVAGDAADPVDGIDRERQRRTLLRAMADLSPDERALVSLRYGADLNATEIGAAVGSAPATVRKSLERARARLAARMEMLMNREGGLA